MFSLTPTPSPYTTSDNLAYTPLSDLFKQLETAAVKPDAVVLMGPFVSVEHPVVKTGHITEADEDGGEDVTLTFEDCFRLYVAEPIRAFLEEHPDIKTTLLLAPSLDDAHHTFCFPQPAFAKSSFQCVRRRSSKPPACVLGVQCLRVACLRHL